MRNKKKPRTPKPPSLPGSHIKEQENLFDQLDEATKARLQLLFGEVEIRRKNENRSTK